MVFVVFGLACVSVDCIWSAVLHYHLNIFKNRKKKKKKHTLKYILLNLNGCFSVHLIMGSVVYLIKYGPICWRCSCKHFYSSFVMILHENPQITYRHAQATAFQLCADKSALITYTQIEILYSFFSYWMEIVYGSHNLHCWHFHFYSIVIALVTISEHFSIWFVNQVSFLMIFGQSFWLLLCVRCTIYV